MNTLFEYMYRDGANWKESSTVIFPGAITDEEEAALWDHMDNGQYFIAGDVNLAELQWEFDDFPSEVDHVWHMVERIELTDQKPTAHVTIHEFVALFLATKWDEVGAVDRLGLEAV